MSPVLDTGRLAALLEAEAANDAILARLGQRCDARVLIATSEDCLHLDINDGALARIVRGQLRMRSWQFACKADDDAWLGFWQPMPRPGLQDIFAMSRFGHLAIAGDMAPLLAHLRYFKRLLALPRGRTPEFSA